MASLPVKQLAGNENLTSCMADLTRIILTPYRCNHSTDGTSPVMRNDAVEPRLELMPLGTGPVATSGCGAHLALSAQPQDAGKLENAPSPSLGFELEGANMFYADGIGHSDGLFVEEDLREPDFDGDVHSLLVSEAQPADWGARGVQSEPVPAAGAKHSSLLYSKSLETLLAHAGSPNVVDAWNWVPAEIVPPPAGLEGFLSDAGNCGVSSAEEALFPVVDVDDSVHEDAVPSSSPERDALGWVPKNLVGDAGVLQSGEKSTILSGFSGTDITFLVDREGCAEEEGLCADDWMPERLGREMDSDEPLASSCPVSPGSIGSGRSCRRRVHPVSKFIGEEVCWTPDDNEGSDTTGSRERVRRGPRTGKPAGRTGRARGRGFNRRSSWDGGTPSTCDAINKRRKQHNPWY